MKKILAMLLSIIMILSLAACSKPEETKPVEPSGEEIEEQLDDQESFDEEEEDYTYVTPDVKRVRFGSDIVGYVDVPYDWITVPDEDSDQLQSYSPDYENTITLDIINVDKEQYTVEDLAYAMWSILEDEDVTEINGAKVTLAGYDAYQLYGIYYYNENPYYIVVWLFEDENGEYRYVCGEGLTFIDVHPNVFDTVTYIEDSYSIK